MNCGFPTGTECQAQQVLSCMMLCMFTCSTALIFQSTGNGRTQLEFLACCLHVLRHVMNAHLGCMCTQCSALKEKVFAPSAIKFCCSSLIKQLLQVVAAHCGQLRLSYTTKMCLPLSRFHLSGSSSRRCTPFLLHLLDGRPVYKLFCYCTWLHALNKTLFYSCGLRAARDNAVQTKAFSIFAKAGSLAALLCVLASFLHEHHTRHH